MMAIRTQDKRQLVPFNQPVYIDYRGSHTIYADGDGTGEIKLGKYESESRCLEILDEIHLVLNCKDGDCGVYQMPEK